MGMKKSVILLVWECPQDRNALMVLTSHGITARIAHPMRSTVEIVAHKCIDITAYTIILRNGLIAGLYLLL